MFIISAQQGRGPTDDFWYSPVAGVRAPANADQALTLSAVWGCVRVKSETTAQLPLVMYRRLPNGGKERAVKHPLYWIVGKRPNPQQTSYEWRQMVQAHVELRGNGYCYIETDGEGRPVALIPLHPDRVKTELLDNGRLRYRYTPRGGSERTFVQGEILHIRGFVFDGYTGMNPIEVERNTIMGAMEAEAFNARFLQSDARPPGWLEHPTHFKDDEAYDNFRRKFSNALTGDRRHAPILEHGMKYHEVGMKLADAEFLASRKYNALQICQIWRMPPHKIQILDQAKWANIEQQSIDFVTDTMMPTFEAWEQRLWTDLLTEDEQQEYFFEYLVDGLMRGDSTARAAYYEKALKNRWMVPQEVRERENLNPVPWGDEPLPMPNQSVRDDRAEQMEQRNAEVVAQKEVHTLRTLDKRHEGAALVEACAAFYTDELAPLLCKVLVVDEDTARRYCDDSLQRVTDAAQAGSLAPLIKQFSAQRAGQLLEIIHA
ncbi:MAG TPA: phage portal protein [Gammaproteobacteria bacterium]|nr:phage portal protein [Gammaproteobacteria bacterium]MCH78828.1 phage portal protein [Gammaproteobacteria bacterium]